MKELKYINININSSKIELAIKDVSWRPFFAVLAIFAIFKQRCWFIQMPEQHFNYLNF